MSPQRSSPLSRDEILSVALAIIDADGLEALTMRRLARDLGVEAMSLYHHVPSKAALLDGVVELTLRAQASTADVLGASWRDTVVGAILGFRRALVAHPNVLAYMISRPPSSAEARARYIEGPLRYLVAQGFEAPDAAHLFEAAFALSFGHALLATHCPPIAAVGVPSIDFTAHSFEQSVRLLIDGYATSSGVI